MRYELFCARRWRLERIGCHEEAAEDAHLKALPESKFESCHSDSCDREVFARAATDRSDPYTQFGRLRLPVSWLVSWPSQELAACKTLEVFFDSSKQ